MMDALRAAQSTPEGKEIETAVALVDEVLRRETASDEPLVQAMARHVTLAGGKRFRPRLVLLAHRAAGGTGLEGVIEAASAIELIHTASLVHDDIIDHADLRRGRWTLHRQHGIGQALVVGDFLFTRGFHLAGCLDPTSIEIFTRACTELCEGEVLEQRWTARRDLELHTYLTVIRQKTAEPVRACAAVGAHLAGTDATCVKALGDYGLAMGMAFQVWDDVLDLVGDAAALGKPGGVDLEQGVLTVPLIYHRDAGGTIPRWPSRRRVLKALEATDALGASRELAERYAQEALGHLEAVPTSLHRDLLETLVRIVIERDR